MTNKRQFKTIDEYIKTFPEDGQNILENGKNLVHFAAFKNHIGFYPTSSGIEAFNKELSPYKGAKGSVQFPIKKTIPYDLGKKIVIFRVKEELEKEN